MTIRNPSFCACPAEDDHGGIGKGLIDLNVEKQVTGLMAEGGVFPQTNKTDSALLRNDRGMNCTVVVVKGDKITVWQSPRGPCTTKNENLFRWLCDGRIPTCDKFHPGGQGYEPAGCRNFRKCLKKWTRMTTVCKKKKSGLDFVRGNSSHS